jgi:uncharacterized protein
VNKLALALVLASTLGRIAVAGDAGGRLIFDSMPEARYGLSGPVGERVQANLENWLLRAPQANPGMLEMFRVRDRQPVPQLVPWAGEFVGKYLISAVQALRLSDDPRLRQQVSEAVAEFIATQADDGYLGPFPKDVRLLKNWDLWGHYHAIYALVLWHDQTGDTAALAAARKAADLVCKTYLDTGRRVFDAGDPEMNMAILTGLAMLHRLTGEPSYLRMAREVEKDWERAGDYLRAGLDGREYFQSPRPRWESLHDLQGLVELWRITGAPKYRDAFTHHWRSIRRWDQRNTGGFSSGEQATGNPYAPTPIETCCTVAWMALTIDYLRLTGDARAADDLELATLNGGLGAQHPSGHWWTYSTPMDGAREASAHTIVFQARAGTPELNCCSVNAPRVLGMLSEWAVMSASDGLALNWLGAGRFTGRLANGAAVTITSSADAWRDGRTELRVETSAADPFSLRVRIPAWARSAKVTLNGAEVDGVMPGRYLSLNRRWTAGDRIGLSFELPLRFVPGANETAGKVSLYRGPVLLTFDQAHNPFDEQAIPAVNPARLGEGRLVSMIAPTTQRERLLGPWLAVEVPAAGGRVLRLVDFASAGARGTRYRSWLPAEPALPAPAFTQLPPDDGRIPAGPVRFQWRGARGKVGASFRLEFATKDDFAPVVWSTNTTGSRVTIDTAGLLAVAGTPGTGKMPVLFWWRVISLGPTGETLADVPPARFLLDSAAPPQALPPEPRLGPQGEIILHALRGDAPLQIGELKSAKFTTRDADGTEVNGRDQMLLYELPAWPEADFTVAVRVRFKELPRGRVGQVFSAWCAGMDDPLRLVVDGGKLFARVEAGSGFSTAGSPVDTGRWYAIAAVKWGGTLTFYLDGRAAGSCPVPEFSTTQARDCALGGNPHYAGNEFLAARFADFAFYARALSAEEIRRLAPPP